MLILGEKVSKEKIKKIFKSMDTSGKGVLTYSNFCKGYYFLSFIYYHGMINIL